MHRRDTQRDTEEEETETETGQRFFHENLSTEGIEMSGQDHRSAQLDRGRLKDVFSTKQIASIVLRRLTNAIVVIFADNLGYRRRNNFIAIEID